MYHESMCQRKSSIGQPDKKTTSVNMSKEKHQGPTCLWRYPLILWVEENTTSPTVSQREGERVVRQERAREAGLRERGGQTWRVLVSYAMIVHRSVIGMVNENVTKMTYIVTITYALYIYCPML